MKLLLDDVLAAEVIELTAQYAYAPEEIISIGIAMATVVLREKGLGHRVVVIDPEGNLISEFLTVMPKAIDDIAKRYVDGASA
jgi:hypothetical protein